MEGCAVFWIVQDAGEAAVGGLVLEVVTEDHFTDFKWEVRILDLSVVYGGFVVIRRVCES